MNCQELRQHWHLYYDSEGDAELHWQMNQHLGQCADCSRWLDQQSALEDAISHGLRGGLQPTTTLWGKIEHAVAPPPPTRSVNWYLGGSASLVLVASLALAWVCGLLPWQNHADQSDLVALSVALHHQLTDGEVAISIASQSHLAIEDYLQQHVTFPVRCPPREDAGFQARGGGTHQLAGDPVAYVVGNVDGQAVSLFIFSRDSLAHYPAQQQALQQNATLQFRAGPHEMWIREFDRNLVVVVGSANPAQLRRLLMAYGSYPHSHHAPYPGQRTS